MSPDFQLPNQLMGVMNDTKWEELRVAMSSLNRMSPRYQIKDLQNDKPSGWNKEWFHHFRLLPYATIEWCDLKIDSEEQRRLVLERLREIHLPGDSTSEGFRIHGWVPRGVPCRSLESF